MGKTKNLIGSSIKLQALRSFSVNEDLNTCTDNPFLRKVYLKQLRPILIWHGFLTEFVLRMSY
jgi:hypothetical protein